MIQSHLTDFLYRWPTSNTPSSPKRSLGRTLTSTWRLLMPKPRKVSSLVIVYLHWEKNSIRDVFVLDPLKIIGRDFDVPFLSDVRGNCFSCSHSDSKIVGIYGSYLWLAFCGWQFCLWMEESEEGKLIIHPQHEMHIKSLFTGDKRRYFHFTDIHCKRHICLYLFAVLGKWHFRE